jgi:2-amino-4-hydroxy-6-hydroxymethyldihydropteridine diphosphokinase
MTTYYLGLGSNAGQPVLFLNQAQGLLQKLGNIGTVSADYISPAYGYPEQEDFVNRVVGLSTNLSPFRLLRRIKQVETILGRTFTFRWGPRLIDIDMLFYHGPAIQSSVLSLPHAELGKRLFFLVPLLEAEDSFGPADRENFHKAVELLRQQQIIKRLEYAAKPV